MVLDVFAESMQRIFEQLHKMKFPLHKALLLENYNGNDKASMADNNTSSFNGRRPITEGTNWSLHAFMVQQSILILYRILICPLATTKL